MFAMASAREHSGYLLIAAQPTPMESGGMVQCFELPQPCRDSVPTVAVLVHQISFPV